MKRVLNFSVVALLAIVVLASCTKSRDHYQNNDIETAVVVDFYDSPYSIIRYDYDNTYAIIESLENDSNIWPRKGDRLRGTFYEGKESRVTNITRNYSNSIYVVENITTEDEAYEALDYYDTRYNASAMKGNNIKLFQRPDAMPKK